MSTALSISSVNDEPNLVARLRMNDRAAFEILVREYTPKMLAVARRFMKCDQDAADAVQDAFISIFRAIGSFEEGSRLWTWLHRIVVNACLMKLRSASRKSAVSIDEYLPTFDGTGHHVHHPRSFADDAFEQAAQAETREQVRNCIGQLPESYRTVLLLRDIEELDTEETARILGCTVANVKTRLHRARQALRKLLEPCFAAQ